MVRSNEFPRDGPCRGTVRFVCRQRRQSAPSSFIPFLFINQIITVHGTIVSSTTSTQLHAKRVPFREEGINQVANAVKVTLGPKGRNAVLNGNTAHPKL